MAPPYNGLSDVEKAQRKAIEEFVKDPPIDPDAGYRDTSGLSLREKARIGSKKTC